MAKANGHHGFGLSFGTLFVLLFVLWLIAPALGIPTSPLQMAACATPGEASPHDFGAGDGVPEASGTVSAITYVADDLSIGGSLISSIRQIGEPTCSAPEGAGQRVVFSGSLVHGRPSFRPTPDRDVERCQPRDGDLVVTMGPDNRIASFVPDYGSSERVISQAQWFQLRGRYQHR